MAWRVEEADVREIMEMKGTPSMSTFIKTANVVVNRITAADSSSVLSTADLREIELYLAAFFAEHRHQQYTSESRAGASASFMGQFGKGLEQNKWGQTAIMLDVSGYLREVSEGVTECSVDWGGLPPSDQTDYVDRD